MTQMGWLWSDINPFLSQAEKDKETGIYVMQGYFAAARPYPKFKYGDLSLDDFISQVNIDKPDFFRTLGEVIRLNDSVWLDEDDAVNKVQKLARESEGKASLDQILQWSVDPSKDISWYSPITEPVSSLVEGVTGGVQSTATLIKYLPYIAVGTVLLYGGYLVWRTGKVIDKAGRIL